MTAPALVKRLARRAKQAGIGQCSPHDLRRSFVSAALEGGPISRWCNGLPAMRRRSPPRGMTVARSTPRLRPPVSCTSRSPGRPRERKCTEHPPAGPASIPEIAVVPPFMCPTSIVPLPDRPFGTMAPPRTSRGEGFVRGAVVCKHMGRRVGYVCARKSPLRKLPHGRIRAVPSAAGDSAGVDFYPARAGRGAAQRTGPRPYPVLMGHGYMGGRPKCLIRAAEIGSVSGEGRIRIR